MRIATETNVPAQEAPALEQVQEAPAVTSESQTTADTSAVQVLICSLDGRGPYHRFPKVMSIYSTVHDQRYRLYLEENFPDRRLNQQIRVSISGGGGFVDNYQLVALEVIDESGCRIYC